MTDPLPSDQEPMPTRLRRIDRWIVRVIGAGFLLLGLLGVAAVLWVRHNRDIGPGDPTLPVICIVVGAAVLTLGLIRLR